jgi:hypothetical protein
MTRCVGAIGKVYQSLSNLTKLTIIFQKARVKRTGSRHWFTIRASKSTIRVLKQYLKAKAQMRAAVAAARVKSL